MRREKDLKEPKKKASQKKNWIFSFFAKKRKALLERFFQPKVQDIRMSGLFLASPAPESVPFTCHYSEDTVITKNGELLQVFKIDGESVRGSCDVFALKKKIREAIAGVDKKRKFRIAFWIHTARELEDALNPERFSNHFSFCVSQEWTRKHRFEGDYNTVLYVTTIVVSPEDSFKWRDYLQYVLLSFVRRKYLNHFIESYVELSQTVNVLMRKLEDFSPRKLTIFLRKSDEVYYSEVISTYARLLRLSKRPEALNDKDLYYHFAEGKIAFGYNSFEISVENEKAFGAMFAFKDAPDVPLECIDDFLSSVKAEMLMTEVVYHVFQPKLIADFKQQDYLLTISKERGLSEALGLEKLLKRSEDAGIFAKRQNSLMLIADDMIKLGTLIRSVIGTLSGLGYMIYRQDLRMQQEFWGQLPGNFSFISDIRAVDPSAVCTFAHIGGGAMGGSGWRAPIATIADQVGLRYKFYLQGDRGGHALVVSKNSQCKAFINFLVTQADCLKANVFYLDFEDRVFPLIKMMQGFAIDLCAEAGGLNPFLIGGKLLEIKEILGFLSGIMGEEQDALHDVVEALIKEHGKRLNLEHFKEGIPHFREMVAPYEKFFGHAQDVFPTSKKVFGVKVDHQSEQKQLSLFANWLLDAIEFYVKSNKNPALIVLNKVWLFKEVNRLHNAFQDWLEKMTALDVIVIFVCDEIENPSSAQFARQAMPYVDTFLFFPTTQAAELYQRFQLNNYALDWLKIAARKGKKHFLLKKGSELTGLDFDYEGLKNFAVLYPEEKNVSLLEECLQSSPGETEKIVEMFCEKIAGK